MRPKPPSPIVLLGHLLALCSFRFLSGQETSPASAEEVWRSIAVPEGFTVERVAGPPLVERPMLASFDDRGRLYVADSAGVNLRGDELLKNPPHKIRRLEDTDGDGRFDKSAVFADRLVFPQGVLWHDGAVYTSSPPSFWKLEDADGDAVADKRTELATGFANTGVADDMHGASLGLDGRLYFCAGRFPHEIRRPGGPTIHRGTAPLILRCRPDGSDLEVVCGSQGNAVGVAFTPAGDFFACGTFLAPDSMGAGLRDALIHCIDGGEYPVRDRILNEHKRTGDLLPPLTHLGVAAASDLTIYRSGTFDESWRGSLFSALFNMHKVVRHALERDGATFKCRNEDFLVSSHADFHPTDVLEDADGSLLVIDTGGWFRIGCPTSQIAKPQVLGAIYRVRRNSARPPEDPRGLRIAWSARPPAELARLLDDPRFAVRDRALAELARRGEAWLGEIDAVRDQAKSIQARIHLAWALCRTDGEPARGVTRKLLADADAGVRQAAARSAGIHRDRRALERLMQMAGKDEPSIRREAATALGRIGDKRAAPALLGALGSAGDRFLEHALIFSLIQIADREAALAALSAGEDGVRRGALIALDQMEGGDLRPEMVTPLIGSDAKGQAALWVITHHPDWGKELLGFFKDWLGMENAAEADRQSLRDQLLAFSRDAAVQGLLAELLRDEKTPASTRLLLLENMAQAPVEKLPAAWGEELLRALESPDEKIARQAVGTVRAAPPDKRPALARIDARIDFEGTDGAFGGTPLSRNFCVQWTGLVRIPRDGKYAFFTESDDGSRLSIDRNIVVDNGGHHAMREASGAVELKAGDHELKVEYFQGKGSSGCKASWAVDGKKEIIPAQALFHCSEFPAGFGESATAPGLLGEYFDFSEGIGDFPDLRITDFSGPLLRIARDGKRPADLRVEAIAAAAPQIDGLEPPLFELLTASLDQSKPPLLRATAAEALGRIKLEDGQLLQLASFFSETGALETGKLLAAYERTGSAAVGKKLLDALALSPGLPSLKADALRQALQAYPADVKQLAAPILKGLEADVEAQKARLKELEPALQGGEVQRGREVFFGKKAVCSTCHAVQGQGGRIGPNLSKIAAIRAGPDLLEAIVFPNASFARGYEPYLVITRRGEIVTGILGRETAEAVYVTSSATSETRVLRSAIKEMQQASVSIMPQGMDTQLTREELSDLLAFLQSLK